MAVVRIDWKKITVDVGTQEATAVSQERGDGSLDWNGGSQDGEKPNTWTDI